MVYQTGIETRIIEGVEVKASGKIKLLRTRTFSFIARMTDTKFSDLFSERNWKPIRNCPGRFILAEGSTELTVADILNMNTSVREFTSKIVPDKVLAVSFDDGSGGLISYVKSDGKFLHTLCDSDGFTRKLRQLEIVVPETD